MEVEKNWHSVLHFWLYQFLKMALEKVTAGLWSESAVGMLVWLKLSTFRDLPYSSVSEQFNTT